MITRDTLDEVHARLMLEYRGLWSIEQSEALYREFSSQTNNADFVEAVHRHQHDRTEGSRGVPIGQYPPSSANIEAQLVALNVERMRAKQDAQQREAAKESNATYRLIMGNQQTHSERINGHLARIREQVRRAAAIRQKLQQQERLDCTTVEGMTRLMDTLTTARDTDGLILHEDQV